MPSSLLPTLTLNFKTDALIHGAKKILIKISVGPLIFLAMVLNSLLHSYLLFVLHSTCHLLDFGSRVLPKDKECSVSCFYSWQFFSDIGPPTGSRPQDCPVDKPRSWNTCSFSPSPTFGKYSGIFNFMMLKTPSSF